MWSDTIWQISAVRLFLSLQNVSCCHRITRLHPHQLTHQLNLLITNYHQLITPAPYIRTCHTHKHFVWSCLWLRLHLFRLLLTWRLLTSLILFSSWFPVFNTSSPSSLLVILLQASGKCSVFLSDCLLLCVWLLTILLPTLYYHLLCCYISFNSFNSVSGLFENLPVCPVCVFPWQKTRLKTESGSMSTSQH